MEVKCPECSFGNTLRDDDQGSLECTLCGSSLFPDEDEEAVEVDAASPPPSPPQLEASLSQFSAASYEYEHEALLTATEDEMEETEEEQDEPAAPDPPPRSDGLSAVEASPAPPPPPLVHSGSSCTWRTEAELLAKEDMIPELQRLHEVFPDTNVPWLLHALQEHDFNVEAATTSILEHGIGGPGGSGSGSEGGAATREERRALAASTDGSEPDVEAIDEELADDPEWLAAVESAVAQFRTFAVGFETFAGTLTFGGSSSTTSETRAELAREADTFRALQMQTGFLDFEITRRKRMLLENPDPDFATALRSMCRTRRAVQAEMVATAKALYAAWSLVAFDEGDPRAMSGAAQVTIDLDESRPAQSMVGHQQSPGEQIVQHLSHSGPWAAYAAHSFQLMLEREQQLHSSFVCFYHSYSFAALLYEVQTEIARSLYGLPQDFAPLPRLLMQPYRKCRTCAELVASFNTMQGRDHDPAFRAVGISTSCSLLASGSEAPPTSCFSYGYSCTDLSFGGLLQKLLEECFAGASNRQLITTLTNDIIAIGNKFGLGDGYNQGQPASYNTQSLKGYMLQIFLHRDIVNDFAYPCHAYGVPIEGTVSQYIGGKNRKKRADGQARVFTHPEVLRDPSKCRLFHYCARPSQMNLDPACPGSRGAFIKELRASLAPLLDSPEAREAVRRRVAHLTDTEPPEQLPPGAAAAPTASGTPSPTTEARIIKGGKGRRKGMRKGQGGRGRWGR